MISLEALWFLITASSQQRRVVTVQNLLGKCMWVEYKTVEILLMKVQNIFKGIICVKYRLKTMFHRYTISVKHVWQ